MLGAGDYDRKVSFHAPEGAEDGMGTVGNGFAEAVHCPAWANVRFGSSADRRSSAEARVADGVVPSQSATFRVRSTAKLREVTQGFAVAYAGSLWGIASIAEIGGPADELEFTATRVGA
ncbi:head-tail adaptor protein [Sphingopyxis sp. J-6]|uniref:head-tail adaptor protein n=1 Tax=Sphingopyxis sp. J-6 TaxID=3122054 RepID=UPI0039840A1C